MPVITIALAAALAAAPADPAVTAEVHAEVKALLGELDRPTSPDAFRRLGPAGEAALAEIALSSDFAPRRARALEVLAALRSPRAEPVHRAVASSTAAPPAARRAAIRGLAQVLPPAQIAGALRPFLEEERDPRVRAAAAEALAAATPGEACGAIRAQAGREETGAALYGRALATCARAVKAGKAPR